MNSPPSPLGKRGGLKSRISLRIESLMELDKLKTIVSSLFNKGLIAYQKYLVTIGQEYIDWKLRSKKKNIYYDRLFFVNTAEKLNGNLGPGDTLNPACSAFSFVMPNSAFDT